MPRTTKEERQAKRQAQLEQPHTGKRRTQERVSAAKKKAKALKKKLNKPVDNKADESKDA